MKTIMKFFISMIVGIVLIFIGILMGGLDVLKDFDPSFMIEEFHHHNHHQWDHFFDSFHHDYLDVYQTSVNMYKHHGYDVTINDYDIYG